MHFCLLVQFTRVRVGAFSAVVFGQACRGLFGVSLSKRRAVKKRENQKDNLVWARRGELGEITKKKRRERKMLLRRINVRWLLSESLTSFLLASPLMHFPRKCWWNIYIRFSLRMDTSFAPSVARFRIFVRWGVGVVGASTWPGYAFWRCPFSGRFRLGCMFVCHRYASLFEKKKRKKNKRKWKPNNAKAKNNVSLICVSV